LLGNHTGSTDCLSAVASDVYKRRPYAPFVIFGSPPHKIFPKKKKLLRWAANGRWYSKHMVNHPGYIGDNYMQRAADDSIRQFRAIVDAATKEVK